MKISLGKILSIILGGIALVILIHGWSNPSFFLISSTSSKHQDPFINSPAIQIGSTIISVEIASTPETRQKGLSGKNSLPPEGGMLFLFPKSEIYGFWMKDMVFPIDIIWIRNKKVLAVEKNVKPELDLANPKIFYPPTPITEVLEVHAGLAERKGLKEGDEVTFYNIPKLTDTSP